MCIAFFSMLFTHTVLGPFETQNSGKTQFTAHCRCCWLYDIHFDRSIALLHFTHQSNWRCNSRATHDMTKNQRCSILKTACDFRKWNINIRAQRDQLFNSNVCLVQSNLVNSIRYLFVFAMRLIESTLGYPFENTPNTIDRQLNFSFDLLIWTDN